MKPVALVLNQDYRPLHVCHVRRALILTWKGKADIVELDSTRLRTVNQCFEAPSVIRIRYYVKIPMKRLGVSRKLVLARDNFQCQYCGKKTKDLTLDHVLPRRLGGPHSWENLVSACRSCNAKKAGKTLKKAGMKLLKKPSEPRNPMLLSLNLLFVGNLPEAWKKYF